jgi:hypothetical protein
MCQNASRSGDPHRRLRNDNTESSELHATREPTKSSETQLPSAPRPKVVLSGLMGYEAAPREAIVRKVTYCEHIDRSAVPLSGCCSRCGVMYLRRYHHLDMGMIIRCIWCGATWPVSEKTQKKPPESATIADLEERLR